MTPSALYGLIGYPLGHSFSKGYFTRKFEQLRIRAEYRNFEIRSVDQLPELVAQHPALRGLNVTRPHKEAVIDIIDEIDDGAAAVGAINTILITHMGKLRGYNTDVYGFRESLLNWMTEQPKVAVVLGTGGASRAVDHVLRGLDTEVHFVSRTGRNGAFTYESLPADLLEQSDLVVNTTPLGMFPATDEIPPIDYGALTEKHHVFDLVYNPPKTLFLKRAERQGSFIKNGLEMLHLQAERSWEIWTKDAE